MKNIFYFFFLCFLLGSVCTVHSAPNYDRYYQLDQYLLENSLKELDFYLEKDINIKHPEIKKLIRTLTGLAKIFGDDFKSYFSDSDWVYMACMLIGLHPDWSKNDILLELENKGYSAIDNEFFSYLYTEKIDDEIFFKRKLTIWLAYQTCTDDFNNIPPTKRRDTTQFKHCKNSILEKREYLGIAKSNTVVYRE